MDVNERDKTNLEVQEVLKQKRRINLDSNRGRFVHFIHKSSKHIKSSTHFFLNLLNFNLTGGPGGLNQRNINKSVKNIKTNPGGAPLMIFPGSPGAPFSPK